MSELDRAPIESLRRSARHSVRAAAVAAICGFAAANAASAQPGMSYESLKNLPDFAGSWTPLTVPFVLPPPTPTRQGAPAAVAPPDAVCAAAATQGFKPDVVARCRQALQNVSAETARASGYCRQQTFMGRPPAGGGGAFEILFTPGRVTMAIEAGLVRRIYMRDKPPAGSLDESRSGTSIGRWEGATLVVETTGLDPNGAILPGSTLGAGAHVLERFSLVDADTLNIESTLVAPAVLTLPLSAQQQYRRARDRVFTDFDTCVEGDRSVDRTTGRDRFDKTPPADLPAPPADLPPPPH
jgi:hypothetical protein